MKIGNSLLRLTLKIKIDIELISKIERFPATRKSNFFFAKSHANSIRQEICHQQAHDATRDTLYMATPGVSPLRNDGILFRQRLSKWVTRRSHKTPNVYECILEIAVAAATMPVRMYNRTFSINFQVGPRTAYRREKYAGMCARVNI